MERSTLVETKRSSNKGSLIIAALCLVGLMSVILVEGGLRIFGISYPVFHAYDPIRGKALIPEKEGWYRSEGEAYIRINTAGFRDREFDLEKKKETYRIAILGDS